jgi:hypothetical protein
MGRTSMQEYFGDVRAFFAPVDRGTEAGTIFDPSQNFDFANPPSPWISLGTIRNFKRVAKSTLGVMRSGAGGVAQSQYRQRIDARVSLDFCEWGKLQMALAAGSQHMNVLESTGTEARASGGPAVAGEAIQAGSTSTLILLDPSVLGNYAAGELIVVDVDYVGGVTELGTGITGGVAVNPAVLDADAVRRVSFNVGRISAVTASGLQLEAPLPGGTPVAGAKVQKVVAFADHEGAEFLQEWSAVFAQEEVSGGRVYFYYPRLQAAIPAEESFAPLTDELHAALLHAEFIALGSVDANDGEDVVCYRSHVPAPGAPAY